MAALISTSLASLPLQEDTSGVETSKWREDGEKSENEATTPTSGVLNATPEPWEGFTSLVEALDILSSLDQQNKQSHLRENAIDGENEDKRKKIRNGRMVEDKAANLATNEDKEGRIFFTDLTGNQDQQVTISVNSVWSLAAWIVLLVLLIKWLVHTVTGRDIGYWGQIAMNS